MAVLLGAFLILGIQPGPNLIKEKMDLVWMLIWALVLVKVAWIRIKLKTL